MCADLVWVHVAEGVVGEEGVEGVVCVGNGEVIVVVVVVVVIAVSVIIVVVIIVPAI